MENLNTLYSENKGKLYNTGAVLCTVGATWYIIQYIYKKILYKGVIKRMQEQLRDKKNNLSNHLKSLNKSSNVSYKEILNKDFAGLQIGLESGRYTQIDILHAYQEKALLMDEEYHFITDINVNAESNILEGSPDIKNSILKGIPISVKDMIYVKGCECTYGMPSFCLKPAERDSTVIQGIRMQGGIPFVITNMCQTGKSIESANPIFGPTLNPHCKDRTSGGSSGGEGAILAAGASILGVGSDIGGSIRIPSSHCGVYGLKPTSTRISRRHVISSYPNQNFIQFSIGPMARTFQDLVVMFKVMTSSVQHQLDPYTPPVIFNETLFSSKKPLRIGYYCNLGGNQIAPVPTVVRAVNEAKAALKLAGHTLVEFNLPDVDSAIFDIYLQCLFTDGGYGFINKMIRDNPVDSSISLVVFLLKIPNIVKKAASYVIYPFSRSHSATLYALAGVSSVYSLWELRDRLEKYRERVVSQWLEEKLDGLICPVMPIAAPLLNTSRFITEVVGYTALWNVLDYPSGSVPVTTVSKADLEELHLSYPRDTLSHRRIRGLQAGSEGMPVGVQCVALPWREEVSLRLMRDLRDHLPASGAP